MAKEIPASHKPRFTPLLAAADSLMGHLLKTQPPRSLPLEKLGQWGLGRGPGISVFDKCPR